MKAIRVCTDEDLATAAPGAYRFHRPRPDTPPVGLTFTCPCGCGQIGILGFRGQNCAAPNWEFDGREDRPTLKEIIRCTAFPCGWTGFLRRGEWVET